jgi:pathogenesis-related protein 1
MGGLAALTLLALTAQAGTGCDPEAKSGEPSTCKTATPAETPSDMLRRERLGTATEPDPEAINRNERRATGDTYWHGNGSIISLHGTKLSSGAGTDYPYGITKDSVQIHQDDDKAAGFFQWQLSDSCKRLKISSTGNTSATLTMGKWDSRSSDHTFKATLPFVLGSSNSGFTLGSGSWYVIKVVFNSAPSKSFRLNAECTTESETSASYSTGTSGTTDGGYEWQGTASVIAHMFRNVSSSTTTDWPYGATKDVLKVRSSSNKPMVFFQWQNDSSCPQIQLDAPSLSGSDKDVSIVIKAWNTWHWDSNSSNEKWLETTLPTTLDAISSTDGRWNVLRVQFKNGVDTTSRVTAECVSSGSSSGSSGSSSGEPSAMSGMTSAHNKVRADKGLSGFTWSSTLADFAQEWATYLANNNNCTMQHRPTSGQYAQKYGENLYWSSAVQWSNGTTEVADRTAQDVVDAWASEEADYNYSTNACASGKQCGHYTQIVWDDTTKVGCAKAICPDDGQIWACNYDPPGNYVGQRPY